MGTHPGPGGTRVVLDGSDTSGRARRVRSTDDSTAASDVVQGDAREGQEADAHDDDLRTDPRSGFRLLVLAPGRRPSSTARGHDVVTPDLPCDDDAAGFAEYTDVVVDAIGDRRELVIVAQSMGAFTAPLVCTRLPVDLLVLVAGHDPDGRARPAGSGGRTPGRPRRSGPRPCATAAIPTTTAPRRSFLHDVPPDVAAESVAPPAGPVGHAVLDARGRWPRGPTCPPGSCCAATTACSRPSSSAGSSADRLGLVPDEMDGGHLPGPRPPARAGRAAGVLPGPDRRRRCPPADPGAATPPGRNRAAGGAGASMRRCRPDRGDDAARGRAARPRRAGGRDRQRRRGRWIAAVVPRAAGGGVPGGRRQRDQHRVAVARLPERRRWPTATTCGPSATGSVALAVTAALGGATGTVLLLVAPPGDLRGGRPVPRAGGGGAAGGAAAHRRARRPAPRSARRAWAAARRGPTTLGVGAARVDVRGGHLRRLLRRRAGRDPAGGARDLPPRRPHPPQRSEERPVAGGQHGGAGRASGCSGPWPGRRWRWSARRAWSAGSAAAASPVACPRPCCAGS